MVMIGIDPHKQTHTAVAIDTHEVVLGERLVRARSGQVRGSSHGPTSSMTGHGRGRSSPRVGSAICWRSSSSPRVNTSWTSPRCWRHGCGCWAADGLTRTIPTTCGQSRSPRCVRRCWCRSGSRTTRRSFGCWPAGTRRSRGRGTRPRVDSTRSSAELVPGGIGKELVVSQASRLLEQIEPVGAVATERHRLACELVDDIARCDQQRKASEVRIRTAVVASGTTLTEIFGVGDVIAATLVRPHRRRPPVPDRGEVRRLQRHRARRTILGQPEPESVPVVAAR